MPMPINFARVWPGLCVFARIRSRWMALFSNPKALRCVVIIGFFGSIVCGFGWLREHRWRINVEHQLLEKSTERFQLPDVPSVAQPELDCKCCALDWPETTGGFDFSLLGRATMLA